MKKLLAAVGRAAALMVGAFTARGVDRIIIHKVSVP